LNNVNFYNTINLTSLNKTFESGGIGMAYSILESVAFSKINNGLKKLSDNQYEDALQIFESAKSVCKKFDQKQKHPTTASVLVGIGAAYHKQGKHDPAIKNYREALSIRDEYYKEEPRPETANLLNIMGELCETSREMACAEENSYAYYNRALNIKEQLYGEENLDVLSGHLKLGTALLTQEKPKEYIWHFEKFLKFTKQTDENKVVIANVEYGLALGYNATNKPIESIEYFKNSLNIWKSLNDSQHIIEIANIMAKIYMSLNQTINAANAFIVGLDEQLRLLDSAPISRSTNIEKASLFVKKGNAYQAKNDYNKSIEYYNEALKFYPKDHSAVPGVVLKMAEEYTKLGDVETSECYNGLLEKLDEGSDIELVGVCNANGAITEIIQEL
jgi:tetratricopeptide (TPR) repeat protein